MGIPPSCSPPVPEMWGSPGARKWGRERTGSAVGAAAGPPRGRCPHDPLFYCGVRASWKPEQYEEAHDDAIDLARSGVGGPRSFALRR